MTDDKEAAEALAHVFETIGIDITTPKGRQEAAETMAWSRKQKQRCDKIFGYILIVIAGGVATMLGSWALEGAKSWLKGPGQ